MPDQSEKKMFETQLFWNLPPPARLDQSQICSEVPHGSNKKKNNPLTAGTFQDWEIFKTYFSSYMRDLHEIYGVKMADMQHSSW